MCSYCRDEDEYQARHGIKGEQPLVCDVCQDTIDEGESALVEDMVVCELCMEEIEQSPLH